MSIIYAMSDIHAHMKPLEENLSLIDLSDKESKLILCGDYIDGGENSCNVLYKIKKLTKEYPNQVVALMGNHEYMFLEFLFLGESDIQAIDWLYTDREFKTINSFISKETQDELVLLFNQGNPFDNFSTLKKCVSIIKKDIMNNHKELIEWLKKLPYYYETENQIFVHAGIDEEAEEYWKYGTPEYVFVSKYPETLGEFYKDIIAGHIGTYGLAKDTEFHNVYFDGKSHFFIDGSTKVSGIIPLLKYDNVARKYSSFMKLNDNWVEYLIK